MIKITAISGGKDRGAVMTPHRYHDGYYIVAKSGNTKDCREQVYDLQELEGWIARGYSVRMSALGHSPSLISPKSLTVIHI